MVYRLPKFIFITQIVPGPDMITHPTDTSAAAPFSAVFTCSASAFGHINITWYKNNEAYKTIANKSNFTLTSSNNVSTSNLTILNVTMKDNGVYYCEAWANKRATQSRLVNLFFAGMCPLHLHTCGIMVVLYVEGVPLKPAVISTSAVTLTVNDFSLSMTCMPQKNNFNYLWERNNGLLPSRARGIHTSHMSITNLMPEDSGEYRCVLSNATGTISSDYFKLTIEGITIYNLFTY